MFSRRLADSEWGPSPIIILICLVIGLLTFELWLGLCVQEDAFISFRYAKNLLDDHGLVYNPGERVEGYTNFLWTVLVASGMALDLDPVPFSRFLGLVVSLALVGLVFASARDRDASRCRTGGLLATALVATSPAVASEAVQGLETVFFTLLVTSAVLLAVAGRTRGPTEQPGATAGLVGTTRTGKTAITARAVRRLRIFRTYRASHVSRSTQLLLSAFLFFLAALTRPEGAAVFGLATVAGYTWWYRRGMALPKRAEWGSLLLFLVLYGTYWLWRFEYYGLPFPNTFYVKTGGGWRHLVGGLAYEWRFLLLNPALALLTVWALVASTRKGSTAAGLREVPRTPLVVTGLYVILGYLAYVALIGGDFKQTFRFITPFLPLWALLLDDTVSRHGWPLQSCGCGWFSGFGRFGRRPTRVGTSAASTRVRPGIRRRWSGTATAWIVLLAVLSNSLLSAPANVKWARRRARDLARRTAAGHYLAEHARPEAVLAIHSAGIIPFYSGLYTIDMWGLNDLHIGHRKMPDVDGDWLPGHEKHDYAYVFSRRPTYFVDEWFYVVSDSIGDLRDRLGIDLAALGVYDLYRERCVPLQLDDGRGVQRYWFNYLERIE